MKNSLYLIEDVSQAHGGTYNGVHLGNIGVFGAFSCYPTKNLGAFGDAGLVVGNDKNIMESIR